MVNRIKELRAQRRMTLRQLAEAVGSTASQISKLERSQRNLTQEWMERIAQVLEVAPAELIAAEPPAGLSENAEPYVPAPGGPLQPVNHYMYCRILTDDLTEHPEGVPRGAVICFDLNEVDTRKILPGTIVLYTFLDRNNLAVQHGRLIGAFMPPNKVCSNRSTNNWMLNVDDPDLPHEPVLRGVMRFVIREAQS